MGLRWCFRWLLIVILVVFQSNQKLPLRIGSRVAGITYATLSTTDNFNMTLSGGNLTAVEANTSVCAARATIGKSSGKWYWEVTYNTTPQFPLCGISTTAAGLSVAYTNSAFGWGWRDNRFYNNGAVLSSAFTGPSNGDVLRFALDMNAGTLDCYLNSSLVGIQITGLSGTYYPTLGGFGGTAGNRTCNFGQNTFAYSVPVGYNPGVY